MNIRIKYAIATSLLFVLELLIALFVHDAFIRPYIGDVLVTVLLCCFLRVFIPRNAPLMPLWAFLFACGVELLQYFQIVRLLGLSDITVLRILIGSTFDLKDILCYGIGCTIIAIIEFTAQKKK